MRRGDAFCPTCEFFCRGNDIAAILNPCMKNIDITIHNDCVVYKRSRENNSLGLNAQYLAPRPIKGPTSKKCDINDLPAWLRPGSWREQRVLPEIETIKRIRLNPGDILVLKTSKVLSEEAYHYIKHSVQDVVSKEVGFDVQAIILEEGLDIEVLGPEGGEIVSR